MRGLLIALEGPDGSGKTTQASRLTSWLRTFHHDVVACRDPGGTELGERLRPILMDRTSTPISMRSEMLLYMASRAQLVEEIITPAIGRGAIVVTDRYLLSNVVYQGYAGGLFSEDIWKVGLVATAGILPDLTLLIDVSPDVAEARIGPARDRIEDRGPGYRVRVRQGYLDALRSLSAPHTMIDGTLDPEIVEAQIRNEVQLVLGNGSRT